MLEKELILFYSQLSAKIVDLRKKMNLTQQVFADKLNISRASIVNIEKERQRPTVHFLYKLSVISGKNMNYFFDTISGELSSDNFFSKKIDSRISEKNDNIILKKYISSKLLNE